MKSYIPNTLYLYKNGMFVYIRILISSDVVSVSFAIVEFLVSHEIGKGQGLSELLTSLGRRSHGDVEAETASLTLSTFI